MESTTIAFYFFSLLPGGNELTLLRKEFESNGTTFEWNSLDKRWERAREFEDDSIGSVLLTPPSTPVSSMLSSKTKANRFIGSGASVWKPFVSPVKSSSPLAHPLTPTTPCSSTPFRSFAPVDVTASPYLFSLPVLSMSNTPTVKPTYASKLVSPLKTKYSKSKLVDVPAVSN